MSAERQGISIPGALFVLPLLIPSLLLGGCGVISALALDESDNGRRIEARVGKEIKLTLGANPTTGYQWQVDELDETILLQDGEAEYKSDSSLIGSGGTTTFHFRPVARGETWLTLTYLRPWEDGVEPAKTFSVHITVNGG